MINREINRLLDAWLTGRDRKPLIVRGARQVGKSYAIRRWATEQFGASNVLEINFEETPSLRQVFQPDIEIEGVINRLNFSTGFDLRAPGKFLFLDEIQSAPEALTALSYFYEKRPEIPVIAAGSLLEFSLAEVSIPVGRVDYLYMHPLNFIEFLDALGKKNLANFITEYNFESQVPNPVHAQLLEHLRLYFRVGGMPKSVLTYLETQDIGQVSKEHSIILSTYRDDFVKYAKRGQAESIEKVFEKLPPSIGGSRTYYQKIDEHISPTRIKRSIELLEKAKILTRCTCTIARELPLKFHAKERLFKLYFVDIGLLQHALGFDWRNLPPHIELPDLARGRLAEQFVAQELLQRRSNSDLYQLHYWDRPVQGSDAEVDFIVEGEASVLPLEVKNGLKGSLAGLHSYIREYAPKKAFVASQRNFKTMESITWIPLYLVSKKLPEN